MPVEIIGEAGTPGAAREWIDAECQLAIKHLKKICGEPPPEMELEIQWQEQFLDLLVLIMSRYTPKGDNQRNDGIGRKSRQRSSKEAGARKV